MADQLVLKLTTKVQGTIKGESEQKDHEGEIDLDHFGFGIIQPIDMGRGGSGNATGAAQYQLATFSKRGDVSSPNLMRAIGTNDAVTEAVITYLVQAGGGKIYQTVTLKNAMFASWNQDTHDQGEPTESFALSYSEIELIHYAQDTDSADLQGQNRVAFSVKSKSET